MTQAPLPDLGKGFSLPGDLPVDWIKLKLRSPEVGAPLLRIQLIVNPAFANGSIAGALLNLAAYGVLAALCRLLEGSTRHGECRHCNA